MADRVGQRLDNYSLTRLLGAGGFGEVYLAEHVYRKTQVAVKVLPKLAEEDLPGFLNEARTIRLRHPHIVQVLDFGVDNQIPFIVMEYISNGTLRQHYPKGSRIPLNIIVLYVKQVADALQYAHDENLIHRDVKPENMLLRSNNDVLLSDFGIVAMAHSSGSQSILEMAGTVTYMAPEQLQGRPVLASDQYSLGVVVYEWLCGERPFQGSPIEIATQHMLASIPPLRQKVPSLPFSVEQVVLTALEKEPKKRFPSVKAFANALEQTNRVEPPQFVVPTHVQPPTPATFKSVTVEELSSKAIPFSSELPNALLPVKPVPASVKPLSNSSASPLIPGFSSSQPIIDEKNRRNRIRMFYPVLLLLALLMVTSIGGGVYYISRANESQTVNQALDTAQRQITSAQGEITSDPTSALKAFSTAQSMLVDVQSNHQLDGTQMQRLAQLNDKLVTQVKLAISAYSHNAKISVLPCSNTSINPIGTISTHTLPQSLAWAQFPNKVSALYTLAQDNGLYQISSQFSLINRLPSNPDSHILNISSNGSHLFVLAEHLKGALPTGYTLDVYQPGSAGSLGAPVSSTPVGVDFAKDGYMPTLTTAWGENVYVVLSQSNATNARVLSFTLDANGHLNAPKSIEISVSVPITSIAAFPNQLFLLLSSGEVQSLPLTSNNQSSSPPTAVFVQPPIALPLATSAKDFKAGDPVPTLTPIDQQGNAPLLIPNSSPTNTAMLTTSLVNGIPHLYIGDPVNHRILDLEAHVGGPATPTPIPTATNVAGSSVVLKLVQQYVSSTDLNQVKSLTVDPPGMQIDVLSQNAPLMMSLVTVSTAPQSVCAS